MRITNVVKPNVTLKVLSTLLKVVIWYGHRIWYGHTIVFSSDVTCNSECSGTTPMNGSHREFLLVNFILTSLFKDGDVPINTWTEMIKLI